MLQKEPPEYLRRLEDLFRGQDRLDDWDLTNVHKVVIGRMYADLEQQIRSSGSSINARDIFGRTALWWAALKGDAASVSTLLHLGADHNIADEVRAPPIHAAVQSGSVEVVQLLLQSGADATVADSWGSTTLMLAIWHNDQCLINLLYDNGVDIDARDKCLGQTALCFAAKTNQVDSAKFLLQLGAELDTQDDYGDSPLFLSIHGKSPDTTQLFVEAGANFGLRNKCGQTILHHAAKFGTEATLRALGSRGVSGVDVHVRDKERLTAEELFKQIKHEGQLATENAFYDLIRAAQLSRITELARGRQKSQTEKTEGLVVGANRLRRRSRETRTSWQKRPLLWGGEIVFAFLALWLALYLSHLLGWLPLSFPGRRVQSADFLGQAARDGTAEAQREKGERQVGQELSERCCHSANIIRTPSQSVS